MFTLPESSKRAEHARNMSDRIAASLDRIKTIPGDAKAAKRLERLTLAARSLATDRRLGPRLPCRLPARLLVDGAGYDTFSRDVGRAGAMFERPEALTQVREVEASLILDQVGACAVRIVALDDTTLSLAFRDPPEEKALSGLIARLRGENAEALALCRRLAADVSRALNRGLDERMFTMATLFSLDRAPVAGAPAGIFAHPAGDALQSALSPVLTFPKSAKKDWLDVLVMDRGGYVAAHRLGQPRPNRAPDADQELLDGQALDDFWTLRAGFAKGPTVQLCPWRLPDTSAPRPAAPIASGSMMKDVAVPITVRGARWGAARMGFECEGPQADLSPEAESAAPSLA
jgi:hypothetical protein